MQLPTQPAFPGAACSVIFESKEDMALAWTTATGPSLVNQLLELDSSNPIQLIEAALSAVMRRVNQNRAHYPISVAVGQLIDRTPSLRARNYEKYLVWEELLGNALINKEQLQPMPGWPQPWPWLDYSL